MRKPLALTIVVVLGLAGVAWVAWSVAGVLWPQYESRIYSLSQPALFGEIAFMFWLLIVGAKPKPLADSVASAN